MSHEPGHKEETTEDPDPIENEDDSASEARFQEQCFLMRALVSHGLGRRLKNPTQKYKNFIKVSSSDPALVMSQLTTTKGADELLDITDKELAFLQPMIRIFKVSEEEGQTTEVEYRFDEGSFHQAGPGQSISIFDDRDTRGAEVGLQSVSFEWMGTQPAEVTNNIRCSMTLFFQNLSALTTKRAAPDGTEYSYADLILRPPGYKGVTQYKPEHYRIKLIVGWARPPIGADIRPEVRDALIRTRTVLNLTLKNHTFSFNMDGTVTMEIEYHAWAEGAMSHPATDIFYPEAKDAQKIKQLDAAEDYSKKQKRALQGKTSGTGGSPPDPPPDDPPEPSDAEEQIDDNITSLRERRNQIKRANRAKAYRRLVNMLLESSDSNIYYIDASAAQLGKLGGDPDDQAKRSASSKVNKSKCKDLVADTSINGQPSMGKMPSGTTAANKSLDDTIDHVANTGEGNWFGPWTASDNNDIADAANESLRTLKPEMSPKGGGTLRVNYFYFGDLLNVCLKILRGGSSTKGDSFPGSAEYKASPASKVSIMCGPVYITNPCTGEATPINIADIPISLNLFTAWFTNTVIRKQVDTYLLRTFVNDVIGTLLPAALGEGCVEGGGQSVVKIMANVLTVRGDGSPTAPFKPGDVVDVNAITEKMQGVDWTGPIGAKKTYDYLFLYATGFSPNWLGGDKEKDRANGIYHFSIGADRGLIKKFEFTKNDAPYLGEAKVTGENNIANDLGGGGIYHCKADLIGNSLFVPGQYIFVNPAAMGIGHPAADGTGGMEHSIANRIRLGGYYFIHKVESTLERGNFTTAIEAKWESGGGKSAKPPPTPAQSLSSALTEEAKAGFADATVDEDDYTNPGG